jgi:hypothetical protein
MTLGKPLPSTAPQMPEWVPIPGRPYWFVSTDGKGHRMYAPPLTPQDRQIQTSPRLVDESGRPLALTPYRRLRGRP